MRRLLLAGFVAAAACADPTPRTPASPPVASAATANGATATSTLVPVHPDDPSTGPRDAPVTIVVFSDFECPFCKRAEPTLAALRTRYGASLRIVWKDMPLPSHKHARHAAVLARVAFLARGNEGFWRLHDRLFEEEATAASLQALAAEAAIDDTVFSAHRATAENGVDRAIGEATQLGVRSTPTFLIDGHRIVGAQNIESFAAVIDEHLARAKQLAQSGVPPQAIYPTLVGEYFQPPEQDADEATDPTVWSVALGNAAVRGPKSAPVTIVTFGDYQSPYCKRLDATFGELEKLYPGKLRFAWKHHPLSNHKRALPAAIAAREVWKQKGDAAFWDYHARLLALDGKLEDETLEAAATAVAGVDAKKVVAAVAKSTWRTEIDEDLDDADALSVRGTPHTFVNGRSLAGAHPIEKWKQLVSLELARAEQRIAAGTAADKLYEEIIKNGKYVGPVTLTIPPEAPVRGGAKAKVVVQVFGDFQCFFCRRLARPVPLPVAEESATLEKLLASYGDKIKIVWRDYPLSFHPRARAAATFAREAKKQKGMAMFWRAHDELFDLDGALDDVTLDALATRLGLDGSKVRTAIAAGDHDAAIDADRAAGSLAGVTGTPATFVNGRIIVGAQGKEVFERAIDRALARAGASK